MGADTVNARSHLIVLGVLLAIHAAMLGYGAWIHSPGYDEIGHLAAGLSHWELGNTDLYRVNPPLVRMVAALPLTFADITVDWQWPEGMTRIRPEFQMGQELWLRNGLDSYRYLTWARWTAIPFSLLGVIAVFQWSKELYGRDAGLCSAAIWCFSPLVIANAEMITPDVGAASLGTWACYAFWKWMGHGSFDYACVAGFLLGLAQLTKFTLVVLFVLLPLLYVLDRIAMHRSLRRTIQAKAASQLSVVLLVAIVVINAGYAFEGTFTQLGSFRFASETLRGPRPDDTAADPFDPAQYNRFSDSWAGRIFVPLPRNYILGIDRQKFDFEAKFYSYLRGQWRDRGWWYYYAYGILVKEPLGFLALFGLTIGISAVRRVASREEMILLAPAVAIFVFVSSQTGFSHHLRYVLPAFPFVFIWMGKLWRPGFSIRWKLAIWGLLVAGITPSLWVFPHSHAYFNRLVGGPLRGHEHLLSSNIDWGQDLLLLSRWAERNPDVQLSGVAYTLDHLVSLPDLGLPDSPPPPGRLDRLNDAALSDLEIQDLGPQPGWWAVFVDPLRGRGGRYQYFLQFEPVDVIGYTVYVYHLSQDDVDRYWKSRMADANLREDVP